MEAASVHEYDIGECALFQLAKVIIAEAFGAIDGRHLQGFGRSDGEGIVGIRFMDEEARRISANMSSLLLEEAPSVPRPTVTPAFLILTTGAMPEASFRLLPGLCATRTCFSCMMAMSSSVTWTQWAASVGSSKRPRSFMRAIGVLPYSLRQFSTSPFVSERWMWIGMPRFIASSRTCRM